MWGKESWESEEVYNVFEIWKEAINNLIGAGWKPGTDFSMFAFPSVDPDVQQASQGAIQSWCINANATDEQIAASKELFAYIGSSEIQGNKDCSTIIFFDCIDPI